MSTSLPRMLRRRFLASVRTFKSTSSPPLSWKSTEKPQQTLASVVEKSGTTLHSGISTTVKLLPAMAGEGRYFTMGVAGPRIPATIDYVAESPLCTSICRGTATVRTVEHLLSALEASGVDNVRIEVAEGDEIPILDGSAREWVEAIRQAGICTAKDHNGIEMDKFAVYVHEPMCIWKDDSFVAAFPYLKTHVTYGISFLQVPAIGCQWFSCFPLDDFIYLKEISPSRTFCIFEQIERMWSSGLIRGGSMKNAIVCSETAGWLNPPLRFPDEACRHKILDLIGDLSLLAENGNQGLPVAHLVAYKAGHALHAKFARHLKELAVNAGKEQFGMALDA